MTPHPDIQNVRGKLIILCEKSAKIINLIFEPFPYHILEYFKACRCRTFWMEEKILWKIKHECMFGWTPHHTHTHPHYVKILWWVTIISVWGYCMHWKWQFKGKYWHERQHCCWLTGSPLVATISSFFPSPFSIFPDTVSQFEAPW